MKRFILLAFAMLAVLAFGATSASTATTTTIGQTTAAADYVCSSEVDLQTGVASGSSFVVPPGNWIVTSWSTYAGAGGGSMSATILRDAGAGSYTVVGESPLKSLTPSELNTFPVNIHVQGGDFLGFWSDGAACATQTGQGADLNPAAIGIPQPAVGATVTPTVYAGYLINISATLIPALPTSKDDCKDGGWQVYGVFKTQGDCVSFVATGGKNPPAH
jgi:hypothetical protein